MFDVIVIGAGVVGGLVARELTKYQIKVAIVEKGSDVSLGATRANSAIVHAGFDAKEGSLKAKLNVEGSKMMENVAAELGVKYKKNGSLVVGFNDEDRAALEELLARGVKNEVEGLKILERDEILAIEPNIGAGVTVALHAPTGAIICPYELCMAAVGNAMDNGAELYLDFEVNSIEKTEGGYKVSSSDKTLEAKYVINCAGVNSDDIARMVGDDSFYITARRGEYMLLDRECGNLVSHTIFRCPSAMGKGILVSPTVDGNLLLGPTAENLDNKTDVSTTADGLSKVRVQANEQVANINMGKVITSFAGLRATGSTGDFVINERDGFVNCAGVESPGLSASPAIAIYVANLLKDAGLTMEENPEFCGKRKPMHYFTELSIDEKNEIIKEHPEYAHIICRCEMVTEGDVVNAIKRPIPAHTIDMVKRRTRAGMGRCQGNYCRARIAELIAEEYNIQLTDVKKFSSNSNLLVRKTK